MLIHWKGLIKTSLVHFVVKAHHRHPEWKEAKDLMGRLRDVRAIPAHHLLAWKVLEDPMDLLQDARIIPDHRLPEWTVQKDLTDRHPI